MLSIRLPQKNLTFSQLFLGGPGISLSWILLAVRFSCTSFQKCWRTFFYFGVRSHWRISQTDVCSMLRLLLPKSLILCKMGPLWKSKIRSLEIPSGSFLEFRFKISFSRNFSASLVTRLGGFRSLMFASPYGISQKKPEEEKPRVNLKEL